MQYAYPNNIIRRKRNGVHSETGVDFPPLLCAATYQTMDLSDSINVACPRQLKVELIWDA